MDPAKSNEVYVTHLTTVEVTSETQVLWAWPGYGEEGDARVYKRLTFHIYEGERSEE